MTQVLRPRRTAASSFDRQNECVMEVHPSAGRSLSLPELLSEDFSMAGSSVRPLATLPTTHMIDAPNAGLLPAVNFAVINQTLARSIEEHVESFQPGFPFWPPGSAPLYTSPFPARIDSFVARSPSSQLTARAAGTPSREPSGVRDAGTAASQCAVGNGLSAARFRGPRAGRAYPPPKGRCMLLR